MCFSWARNHLVQFKKKKCTYCLAITEHSSVSFCLTSRILANTQSVIQKLRDDFIKWLHFLVSLNLFWAVHSVFKWRICKEYWTQLMAWEKTNGTIFQEAVKNCKFIWEITCRQLRYFAHYKRRGINNGFTACCFLWLAWQNVVGTPRSCLAHHS